MKVEVVLNPPPAGRQITVTVDAEGDEPIDYRTLKFCAETLENAAGYACVAKGLDPVTMAPYWPVQAYGRRA